MLMKVTLGKAPPMDVSQVKDVQCQRLWCAAAAEILTPGDVAVSESHLLIYSLLCKMTHLKM